MSPQQLHITAGPSASVMDSPRLARQLLQLRQETERQQKAAFARMVRVTAEDGEEMACLSQLRPGAVRPGSEQLRRCGSKDSACSNASSQSDGLSSTACNSINDSGSSNASIQSDDSIAACDPSEDEDSERSIVPKPGESPAIIFDWDDTLMPTWFIENVVKPCTPATATGEEHRVIEEDSPFFEMLQCHAQVVKDVLVAASRIARVAIVTLAKREWVETSARYLPGFDLEELLSQCNIHMYYARETMSGAFERPARSETAKEANPWVAAKRTAMSTCLRSFYRAKPDARWNVTCIGDSLIEQEAIKECLRSNDSGGNQPLCKTIKFMEEPNSKELNIQLCVLSASLKLVIDHDADFDLSMETGTYAELCRSAASLQQKSDYMCRVPAR
jgi:hypothetical protein